jgi:hypothetical protein
MLLTSEPELEQATTAADLVAACFDIECAIDDELDGVTHGCRQIVVEVTLAPNRPADTQVAVTPNAMPKDVGDAIANRVRHLPFPVVRQLEVRFQLFLTFNEKPAAAD